MKKIFLTFTLVLVATGLFFYSRIPKGDPVPAGTGEYSSLEKVGLQIEKDGEFSEYEFDYKEHMTAFSVLESASAEGNFEIVKIDYDFGVFVSGIDGVENTDDLVWIYFVNDASGDVAADQKILEMGDIVEWKYIEPIY